MTEDQISELLLQHANGRPLRDVLAEVYGIGENDGYSGGYPAGYNVGHNDGFVSALH